MVSINLNRCVAESYRIDSPDIEIQTRFIGRQGFEIGVRLYPTGRLVTDGFPVELALIRITPTGLGMAWPLDDRRLFYHRNPNGDLCMWFPGDPPSLRWTAVKPLVDLILITRRHLIYEEFYRRNNWWPVEDVPHGFQANTEAPIKTSSLRRRLRRTSE